MFRDGIIAMLPVLGAIGVMVSYTLLRAGVLPDYISYLDYLSVYNLFSPGWSISANSMFYGWGTVLLIVFLGLADAWRRIFDPTSVLTMATSNTIYYKIVPMLLLSLLTSLYFVGRSVDYTLVLALLPVTAIIVPSILYLIPVMLARKRYIGLFFFAFPTIIFILSLSFSLTALSRVSAPYSFYLQECRDQNRCTPTALTTELNRRLNLRSGLEITGNGFADSYYDASGTIADAMDLLERLQPDQSRAVVLIGPVRNIRVISEIRDQIASDFALLHSGKWHRWPRSTTFTDELLPSRLRKILDAPVVLNDKELVLVRMDEGLLGPLEAGILQNIRAKYTLCRVPDNATEVAAYRVSLNSTCP